MSAGEGSILSILCATVSGIVAINKQMDNANTTFKELQKQNDKLGTAIHDIFSKIANETTSSEDVRNLNNTIRDVSYHTASAKK